MNAFTSWLPAAASAPAALVLGLLAKITVVLALAWIAHLLMRGTNPRWRILLWRVAGLGLLVVAALGLREPLWQLAILPVESTQTASVDIAPPVPQPMTHTTSALAPRPALPPMTMAPMALPENTNPTPIPPAEIAAPEPTNSSKKTAPNQSWSWWHWPLLVWAIGLAWGVARMIVGSIHLSQIRRSSEPVPGWITEEISAMQTRAGRPALRQTGAVATPCSIGLFRNTILLPTALCEPVHRGEIRAALSHEIAHFRGHDLHWNGLLHVLAILLWFHPLAWRIRLAHADACDERCDAEAARQLGDSAEYGRTLARLALQAAKRTAPVALSMARRSNVSRRIAVLRSEVGNKRLSRWRAAIVASLVGSLLLGIGAVGLAPSRAEDATENAAGTTAAVDPVPIDVGFEKPLAEAENDDDAADFQFPKARRTRTTVTNKDRTLLWFYSGEHVHFVLYCPGFIQTGLSYTKRFETESSPFLWWFEGSVYTNAGQRERIDGKVHWEHERKHRLLFIYAPPKLSLKLDGQSYNLEDGRVFVLNQQGEPRQLDLAPPSAEIDDNPEAIDQFVGEIKANLAANDKASSVTSDQQTPNDDKDSDRQEASTLELTKKVRVVDPQGDPIKGATVEPWAIRSTGHALWNTKRFGPPPVLTTNAKGVAVIPFPRYANPVEKIPPRALTVRVAHPDFAETMSNAVPVTPDKRDDVTTITMRPGAIVDIVLKGHKAKEMSADHLYALTDSKWFRKVLVEDNGRLHLPRIPAGMDMIRLVYLPDDGPPVFSKAISLKFIEGERVALQFIMQPSVSVTGMLSENVPRPVKNGRVVAEVIAQEEEFVNVSWRVWSKVNEDGSFTLDGLPRGALQVIAICDGYMAESGEPPKFISEEDRQRPDSRPRPQVFELKEENTPITLEMTKTGSARFRVLGPDGDPVEGAKVSLWPNVRWWGGGSQVYAEPLIGSITMIKHPEQARKEAYSNELFSATTNENGMAFVKSLPPGGQNYAIQHDTLEMPLSEKDPTFRYGAIKVTAGETTEVTVKMQPRGTQPLEKRQADPVDPPEVKRPSRRASIGPKPQPPKVFKTQADKKELAGVVVDEQGNPLEGVTVDAWTWHAGNETKTDATGRFVLKFSVVNDTTGVEIEFTKKGYSPSLFIAQDPGIDDWTIVLTQGTWLEGIVTDPSGKPVADTLVRAKRGPFRNPGVVITEVWTETQTDEKGKYRLHLEPDTYEVQVRVPKVGVVRQAGIKLATKEKKTLDLQLESGVTFRAIVRDSLTNKPVEGIILWNWKQPGIEGVSDENGILEIPHMFEGEFQFNVTAAGVNRRRSAVAGEYARWWSLQAIHQWGRRQKKPGEFQRNFDSLTFNLKKNGEEIEIFVEPAVTITGHVLDPNGKPVEGATVTLAKTGSGNSITGDTRYSYQTDKQGRFEMKAPASGDVKYNLIAHDGKFSQWRTWANGVGEPFQTTPGQKITGVELQLTKPGIVRGQVTNQAGEPVVGAKVLAAPIDGLGNRYYFPTTRTDENGEYELKFVRPGKQRIQIEPFWLDPSQAPAKTTRAVEVTAGEMAEGIDFTTAMD